MALPIFAELFTDLTFTLSDKDEEVFIKINGVLSSGVLSIKILDPGALCTVRSTLSSNEFTNLPSTTYEDCLWEDIKINGIQIPIVSSDVKSTTFWCPNLLHIKNVSESNLKIQFSLRGNR